MLGGLANHHREFSLVIEAVRHARSQRLGVGREQRRGTAQEKPRVHRLFAPAFLGMIEIVQAQAQDLAGLGHQGRQGQICKTQAWRRGGGGRIRGAAQIDAIAQSGTQIGRHLR